MGSIWDHFGINLGSILNHFGINLESFWVHFEVILGSSGNHLGQILTRILVKPGNREIQINRVRVRLTGSGYYTLPRLNKGGMAGVSLSWAMDSTPTRLA